MIKYRNNKNFSSFLSFCRSENGHNFSLIYAQKQNCPAINLISSHDHISGIKSIKNGDFTLATNALLKTQYLTEQTEDGQLEYSK